MSPDDRMQRDPIDYSDPNALLDAGEDRWAWRARIRSNPTSARIYRMAVFVLGLVVVVVGLALVPLPGPGWVIVFVGVAIWASEFEKAQQLRDWGKARLSAWNTWVLAQPWWIKLAITVATMVLVGLVFWGLFVMMGVPTWLPDPVKRPFTLLPGVD